MTETESKDLFLVEHDENYVLTPEQTHRLIWNKFERNIRLAQLTQKREAQLIAD